MFKLRQENLSSDLKQISSWCDLWGMRLNAEKTKSMVVSRSRTAFPVHQDITLNNTIIENVQELKILGVVFDSKFTFENHLRTMLSNSSRKLGIVRKASFIYRDSSVDLACFRSFVLPLLEYCSPVWSGAAETHLNLLN